MGKEDHPAASTPCEDARPQLRLRILLETSIHHSYAGHASLHAEPSLLQHRNQGLTKVQVLLKMIYKALILYKTPKAMDMYTFSAVI